MAAPVPPTPGTWPVWATMALISIGKEEFIDKPKRRHQGLLRAKEQALSPFLRNPSDITPAPQNKFGDTLMQAGMAGLAIDQQKAGIKQQSKLQKAQIELMKKQGEALARAQGSTIPDALAKSQMIGAPMSGYGGMTMGQSTRSPYDLMIPQPNRYFTPMR